MSLNQLGLGFLFTAKDEASAVMKKVESHLGRLGGQAKQVEQGFVASAIGSASMVGGMFALKGAFSVAKEAGTFEQALVDVKSISGASATELKLLEDAAIKAGIATQFSPHEAVGGLRDLAAAGYNAVDSIRLLNPALDLAAGSLGQLSPQEAAGVAAQTLKAFKMSADDAAAAVDKLLASANLFSVEARELPALIGHISRGATIYGASLTDALTSAGLAKNILGSIEIASTGVSVAMERLIKSKPQSALKSIGVDVVDAQGKLRPFLDLLTEMGESRIFQKKTDAGKASFINETFGHHALGAVNAILVQLNSGIKDMQGNTLKGAAAVAYLRDQFEKSGGTAKAFADARLDTLPGQMKLLEGSMATLRVVIGKELTPVFKPIVEGIVGGVNKIIKAWRELDPGTRSGIMKFVVAAGAVLTVLGGILTAVGGVGLLSAGLAAVGVSLDMILAAALPTLGVLAALVVAGSAFFGLYQGNVGGFADTVNVALSKVSLAFQGLWQLFSSGEFSGSVMDDLNKAENGGVKAFAINVYVWVARIKTFVSGLIDGFSSNIEKWKPVWSGLLEIIKTFAGSLGMSTGAANDNADTFDKFTQAGRDLGTVLSTVVGRGLEFVRDSLQLVIGVVQACRSHFADFWRGIGNGLQIAWGAIKVFLGLLTGNWSLAWSGLIDIAIGVGKRVVNILFSIVNRFAWVFDKINGWMGINSTFVIDVEKGRQSIMDSFDESGQFWKRELASGDVPAVAANQSQASATAAAVTAGVANMSLPQAPMSQLPMPTVQVNMSIDGERIGTAVAKAQRSSQARSFMSVADENMSY